MRSRRNVRPSEMKDGQHTEEDEAIKVTVKTCRNCGHVFVEGYHGSLGIQFWLSALTFLGGIIYWAVRGRRERCPVCKKSILIERKGVVIIDEPGGNSNYEKDPSSKKEANFTLCPSCGRKNIPDSVYCEGCGKKWT